MARTTPPLAVPSSFVRTIPVMPAALLNSLVWFTAFCPVVASSTRSTSLSESGSSLSIILFIFSSSAMRFFLLCSLPAVSAMITSLPLAFADEIASKTTAAGSEPSFCLMISAPALSAHTCSWSIAAARKVSAAASVTLLPSLANLAASLPIVVVFPTPLTPITRMIEGFVDICSSCPPFSISVITSARSPLILAGSVIPCCFTLFLSSSHIFSAVTIPTSPITRSSSSSSKSSSSIFVNDFSIMSIFPKIASLVFFSPSLILVKILIIIPPMCLTACEYTDLPHVYSAL